MNQRRTATGTGAVAFSPDGRTQAVGGDAGTLRLWDTEYAVGAPVPTQRHLIGPGRADLTSAQWRTFVDWVPYRKVCGR